MKRSPAAGAAADTGLRRVAALTYDDAERHAGGAPRVVAKGQGLVADEILRRAQDAGVPIHASRELVSLLMQVDLDQHIPPQLYVAVAEVLAWAYRLERQAAPELDGFSRAFPGTGGAGDPATMRGIRRTRR